MNLQVDIVAVGRTPHSRNIAHWPPDLLVSRNSRKSHAGRELRSGVTAAASWPQYCVVSGRVQSRNWKVLYGGMAPVFRTSPHRGSDCRARNPSEVTGGCGTHVF